MSGFISTERRLILRIQDYWNYLRQDRAFPRTTDIDPVELDDDWCDCFMIQLAASPETSTFLFLGPRLLENARLPEDWARASRRHVRDCPPGSMIARSVRQIAEVPRQRIPVGVAETFHENGEEVKLRGMLFPLSSNGEDIDALLGAANCARLEALRLQAS